jgi:hypothetical protein
VALLGHQRGCSAPSVGETSGSVRRLDPDRASSVSSPRGGRPTGPERYGACVPPNRIVARANVLAATKASETTAGRAAPPATRFSPYRAHLLTGLGQPDRVQGIVATPQSGIAMQQPKRRRSDRALRARMQSQGRPPVARREDRQRFWAAIAKGLTTEEAGLITGISPAVAARWFRLSGGMPSVSQVPLSGRYLSFVEREEVALLRASGCGVRAIARRLHRFSCSCVGLGKSYGPLTVDAGFVAGRFRRLLPAVSNSMRAAVVWELLRSGRTHGGCCAPAHGRERRLRWTGSTSARASA